MGTVTKVMLVLIILAGGAGIFFGLSAPPKIEALHKTASEAKAAATAKQSEIDKLQGESSTAKTNLENKIKEVESMTNKVASAEQTAVAKTTEAAQNAKAVTDLAVKEQELVALGMKYAADQIKLNGLPKLERDLATYQGLTFNGQPVPDANTLQGYLDALKELKRKSVTNSPPPPPPPPTIGKVTNVDPKFGFIQIDFRAADAPVGTVFKVKRGGTFVGQIKVVRSVGTSSYCQVDKANTPGQVTLGDTVEKSK